MRSNRLVLGVGQHALMVAVSVLFVAPFVIVALTAVMTDNQALSGNLWPHPFRWSNFSDAWDTVPLLRYGANTLLIAALSTAGVLVSSIPAAYALGCLRWRGQRAVLVLVITTLMLPVQATVVPLYVVFAKLHWVGSLRPLIIPAFFGDAFAIFLLRQFFMRIPPAFADTARAEGAGEFQVLTRVIVPLAKPAIAAVALFNFVFVWNDFYSPFLYLGENRDLWTLSLGLAQFRSLHRVEWNLTMATSVLVMLPMIVLFLIAQKAIIEGVTLTGTTR